MCLSRLFATREDISGTKQTLTQLKCRCQPLIEGGSDDPGKVLWDKGLDAWRVRAEDGELW